MVWVVLRQEAEQELLDAQIWYEKRSRGLGLEFIRTFEVTLAVIQRDPEIYPLVVDDVRHVRCKRFPYAVCYRFVNQTIRILAVVHLSREPSYWHERQ